MQEKFKNILTIILFFILIFPGKTAKAQHAEDFRFSEILVYNDSNYVDEYGIHDPWIEIVNSSYSNINIAGCYLTDDLNNPKKYWIPTGSPQTLLAPRSYVVFYAENHPSRGIFHVNFDLKKAKVIALFDANGRTLIDKLEIPGGQKTDKSYARISPDSDEWIFTEKTTPGSDNDHSRKASSGELFVKMDPDGIGMTLIAMSVVFSALVLLYLIFKNIGRAFTRKKKGKEGVPAQPVSRTSEEISGEVNAAIAAALYMYQNESHDYENTVLTIRKVARPYSPWSSKIYTLRKTPR